MYSVEELIRRWEAEQITAERVIGQLLLQIRELHGRMASLERHNGAGLKARIERLEKIASR